MIRERREEEMKIFMIVVMVWAILGASVEEKKGGWVALFAVAGLLYLGLVRVGGA